MVAKLSYEECRLKRVEENKKRMEALNLPLLSQSLQKGPRPPSTPSPMKRVKPRTSEKKMEVVVRRSSRNANKSPPVYKEVDVHVRVEIPRRVCKGRVRDLSNRVYASDEARAAAIEKAEKLELSLESGHPSFIKPMLQSHVTGGFWLGLPAFFCRKNLPKNDEVMTLIDEDGDEYPSIYLARKSGLSGGWKGFAVAHDLVDGDALVFQLIQRTTFQIHIIRVNSSEQKSNLSSSES